MDNAKRTVKDSVFRDLFSDKKYLLQLYQALHPEDTTVSVDDLQNVTIESVITDGIYNDLGFQVKDKILILIEAQSTWSENILIRSLIYLMRTYQEYFEKKEISLYGSKKVSLPKPELYVIYTKEKKNHPELLSFKESFFGDEECCLEAKIKVLYEDKTDSIINQYIKFCMIMDDQIRRHGRTMEAVKKAIAICRDEKLLDEYLRSREVEVEGIMFTLFDQEKITKFWEREIREESRAEGRAEGLAEGRAEAKAEAQADIDKLRQQLINLGVTPSV